LFVVFLPHHAVYSNGTPTHIVSPTGCALSGFSLRCAMRHWLVTLKKWPVVSLHSGTYSEAWLTCNGKGQIYLLVKEVMCKLSKVHIWEVLLSGLIRPYE
jgi:hypothetical protein